MDTKRICSVCGKPLAPSALEGLCPECLLKAGLGTGVDIGPDTGGKAPRFTPPKIEELAAKFPQLEILEFIGQGGMGAVYKARQKQLDRIVALKILPPQAGGLAFAERFTREARALAKLNHPHIITLYEFGQSDGLFYFLMEFVDGVNLRQLLSNSRVSPREALAIVPQICEALQFAHDSGIVHRDIKPENILLDKKGLVKIADFGVAKMIAESLSEAAETSAATAAPGDLTEAGSTLGTPQYMAPEQIKNSAEVDHRADIYSLGVVFYQMLTGELPSGKIEPPSRKVRIDVRLDEVVLRALEKKPGLRFQQASDVKIAVETIATTPQTQAPETPPGFKHYKNSEWNFELDIPEGWNKFPPDHKNSPAELLRFALNENGTHLLIIFRTRSYLSLKDAPDWAQKILAKAGFGNFVTAERTIGNKSVRTLDFDRPKGDGTWSCRHYFFTEGTLSYVLGFGTTDKAGMFEIFDLIAKSFRFQPSDDEKVLKPFFPKTKTVAADEPKQEPSSQKAEPEPHSEGYTVRIEPVNPPKLARRFGIGAVFAFLAIILAIPLAAILLLRPVQPTAKNVLSEAAFLRKFDSNQIAQATITYPTVAGGAATITGKFIETDANGKIVEQNGQPVEENFVAPNVMLTRSLEDKLLPSNKISVNIPNPMLSDIGYQLLFFVFVGSIAMIFFTVFIILVIYFFVRKKREPPVIPGPGPGASSAPNRRTWFNRFLIALLAAIVIAFFLRMLVIAPYRSGMSAAAPNNPRGSESAQTSVPFHFRIFEADADLVKTLIPSVGNFRVITHDAETEAQTAQITPAVVHSLLQNMATEPGLLVDQTRLVSGVSQTNPADSWHYHIDDASLSGGGAGNASFGVRKENDATQVRIDGWLYHGIDNAGPGVHFSLNSSFLYEGTLPQTNELAFLVPFVRHDGSRHYVLTVFDFNGLANEESPRLSLNGPPFKARLYQATVELAFVGNLPWTNPVCWYPNGRPSPKAFPTGQLNYSLLDTNVKKLVFYIRNQSTNDVSTPICHVDGADYLGTSWGLPPYFGVTLSFPTNTTTANLSIGVANGPWETVISLDHSPHITNSQGLSDDNWRGSYDEPVTGPNGDVAIGCTYTTRSNWVSRIVYVNDNGKIVPISERSTSDDFSNPGTGTLLISSNEYAHIKQFLVQRRKFQWVDFDNISLQQGHLTSVTAKVY